MLRTCFDGQTATPVGLDLGGPRSQSPSTFHIQALRIIRAALIAFGAIPILVLATAGPTSAQEAWETPASNTQYARDVQRSLANLGCYKTANGRKGPVDGRFGDGSQHGMQNFLEARFPGSQTVWENLDEERFLALLRRAERETPNLCNTRRSADYCDRSSVGPVYLKKFTETFKEAQAIEASLKFLKENFDDVFPAKSQTEDRVAGKEELARLKRYGAEPVSRATTEEAVRTLLTRFRNLTFKYGFTDIGACGACKRINDWKFLKNFAQRNGGYLTYEFAVEKDGTVTISTNPNLRFKVDNITLEMMYGIQDHLLIFRRMSQRWLEMVEAGRTNYQYVSTVNNTKQANTIEISELSTKRVEEMNRIVFKLLGIEQKKVAVLGAPPDAETVLMTEQAYNKYTCDGFDGRAIDAND